MNRLKFHEQLVSALGSRNVYYQPPENIRMQYPCIVYSKNYLRNRLADNEVYVQNVQYKVTAISKDPDDPIFEKLSKLSPKVTFATRFTSSNLHHEVYNIYE